jgi:DNA-binding XRE family transcriptional regulator
VASDTAFECDVKTVRRELGLTQAELATLLGVSKRTIQSCEQGWRKPSAMLERMALLLLIALRQGDSFGAQACWAERACAAEKRADCIAYRTRQGHICWLLTGTKCGERTVSTWADKKTACCSCGFFQHLLEGHLEEQSQSRPPS